MDADKFFTPTNILSVGVATVAVNMATNALYRLAGAPPKITAFGSAMVLAYLVVAMEPAPQWYEWVLAFFNGCLLFCSALGLNETGAKTSQARQKKKGMAAGEPLWKSWLES